MFSMTVRRALGLLGPWTGLVVAAVVVAGLILVGRGLGLRWDPFDRAGARRDRAEAARDAAVADAAARRLEREGAAEQSVRRERRLQTIQAADRAVDAAIDNARTAHDAASPLDPDRADRLRLHDRGLCALAPDLCAAPASADPG